MEKLRKEVRVKKALYTRSLTALDRLVADARTEVEVSLCIDSIKEKKASLSVSHEKLLAAIGEEEFEAELESFAELESMERASLSQAAQLLNRSREATPIEPPPAAVTQPHLQKLKFQLSMVTRAAIQNLLRPSKYLYMNVRTCQSWRKCCG